MTKRKLKRLEKDIRSVKHSLELVRTIVPMIVLILQIIILGRITWRSMMEESKDKDCY